MGLMRRDGVFERMTQIEQRLERLVHKNLEELRRLRNEQDAAERRESPGRACPF